MQQQQGGSRYGVPQPEMAAAPLPSGAAAAQAVRQPPRVEYRQPQQPTVPEEASPIRSRPGPLQPAAPAPPASLFEEFGAGAGGVRGNFPDDDALGASEEAERAGGAVGNRWPRQETLALLKIRSEMDSAFRDSPLKGPLWDDVSRKLTELGYARSAKKCKEKFENVHKYYRRTKESRAGRQDGKSYRFFTQLEAIQSSGGAAAAPFPSGHNTNTVQTLASAVAAGAPSGGTMKPTGPPSGLKIQPVLFPTTGTVPLDVPAAGISFSSNTSSSSASDTDGDETEEGVAGAGAGDLQGGGRKRKREGWLIGSRKMKSFFDGLMKQIIERQEIMQQRFFETIEKQDQDRMIREENWKRQEISRLNREHEMMAQERAVAASRDAAVISFLEKFADFPANHSATVLPEAAAPPPPSSPPQHQTPPAPAAPVEVLQLHMPAMEFDSNDNERNELALTQLSVSPDQPVSAGEAMAGGSLDIFSPSSLSSRWPKPEVLALIRLRSGLETRYLESGPKGPLWEEISLGMKRLGYSRNPKRCKEKWENINKYFKKVKESNKKRSEDAKTCPYFHELDALYRKKQLAGGGAAAAAPVLVAAEQQQQLSVSKSNPQPQREPLRTLAAPPIAVPTLPDRSNIADGGTTHEMITGDKVQRANGTGIPQVFFAGAPNRGGGAVMKKPEDFIRELMEQQNQPRQVLNPVDSDTMNHEYDDEDEDYDDDEEEEDDGKLQYEIQFQRQGVGATAVGARAGNPTAKVATAASSAGSFLAMVQ